MQENAGLAILAKGVPNPSKVSKPVVARAFLSFQTPSNSSKDAAAPVARHECRYGRVCFDAGNAQNQQYLEQRAVTRHPA